MALAAYRSLLRAARIAFQDDKWVLNAALGEARKGFKVNRGLAPGSEEVHGLVKNAYEVAAVLRTNVVQGRLNDDGRYQLRIHNEIEKGDNESIKQPISTLGGAGPGKCCSS